MDSVGKTKHTTEEEQAQQGHVSARAAKPKDETNRKKFMEEFSKHVDLLPQAAHIVAYTMLEQAELQPGLADKMREKLWSCIQKIPLQVSAVLEDQDVEIDWWLSQWPDKISEKVASEEPTANTAIPSKFTEEENQLAEKYKVEAKLIRLIAEIVSVHTAEITELLKLVTVNREQGTKEKVLSLAEKQEPTITGLPFLDELLASASYPATAMAYACLRASWIDNELGDKLQASLGSSVDELLEKHRKDDRSLDIECDILPAIKWLAFLKGLEVGSRDELETELREPAKEEKQPVSQTASAETEQGPEPEPEKESYGFDPKERVRAYKVFEQYLNTRSLEEKQAALALSMLLGKQQYLPDEQIGYKIYKQWRAEVLAVGSPDQLQLEGIPGNEAFCQGYLTAMIIMNG